MRALRLFGRAVLALLIVVLGLVAVAGIVVVILTGTPWGHERVRRIAVSQLQQHIAGRARIGSISGNLLSGFVIHDLAISDSAGRPFLAVAEASAKYGVGDLFGKRLYFDDVRLVRPVVVLDRPPGGKWNYQAIFRMDTTKTAPSTGPGFGSWIRLTNVAVVDGQLTVRTPWKPSEALQTTAARDSAVREVVSGGSRLMVEPVPGGFQKVVQLRTINAAMPLLRLADPSVADRLARVSSLQMQALAFRPPAAVVTAMRGDFHFDNDSLWWRNIVAAMPNSKVSGDGSYAFSSGDMLLDLHGAPAALADLRWLYPRLPAEGGGTLDFLMRWRGAVQDYIAKRADITVGAAHVAGNFGFTLADTFTIHDTDLRIANLDTRLLEQLIPHFTSPRRGVLSGTAIASGGKHALLVNADMAFADRTAGTSRVAAAGEVGFLTGGLRARNLRLRLYPVQVELARQYMPTLPISGTVVGTAYVNGSTDTQLLVQGDLTHTDRGALSRLDGRALVRLAGTKYFDVDARVHPLSLAEVGRFMPSVGLVGSASGPLRVRGTLANLQFNADLRLPDGGQLAARGSADLAARQKGYSLAAGLKVFNLHSVVATGPATSLSGRLVVAGRGFDPKTMRATVAADFGVSRWDSLAVDTASVRVAIADGLLQANRVHLAGAHTALTATGAFGLAPGRSGTLTYRLAVDSLGALNRLLPKTAADTGRVAPRPARVQAALARARADSARIAQQTEVERAVYGKPAPKLNAKLPPAVPRDTMSGSLIAAGTIRGNLQSFDLRGRLAGEDLIIRGSSANRVMAEYAWLGARTPASQIAVGVTGDSITVAGFSFDSVDARLAYRAPIGVPGATLTNGSGRVEVVVLQGGGREYALKGDFALQNGARELRIANASLQFDTTQWRTVQPAVIRMQSNGVLVQHLELHDLGTGRIYADGLLPTAGNANFRLAVDNLQVGSITALLQSDVAATGVISLDGTMAGTLANPTFRGAFGLVDATYRGSAVPDLHGTFAYAAEQLTTHLDALREGGPPLLVADARLPINLALQGVTGSRLPDRPMMADVTADSLPLDLIPHFTDAVSQVRGVAVGRFAVRGTLKHPSMVGALNVVNGQLVLNVTGMRITNVAAAVRMLNDSVYVDSISARARGTIFARGTVALTTPNGGGPAFNLFLVARDAEIMNSERGRLRADMGLAFTGPLDRAYLSGQATVTQGVVYVPHSSGATLSANDPGLFAVVDTAVASEVALVPQESALLANLRIDMQLGINRNTWVRSREANVEVYTEYPINVRYRRQQLSLVGAVATDRGEYTFLSKRFQVQRGSAMFTGGAELNPLLQITAQYNVPIAGQPELQIEVVVGGTMRRPNVALTSNSQPPKSQSELLSYLAFGRSTSSLLDFGSGSSVAAPSTTGNLAGYAQMATQQLAAVALGVVANEVQAEAGRALGTDVLNVTPADVPPELLQGSGVGQFLMQTRIEAGKYLNPRTYLGFQQVAQYPGLQIQYRTSKGWLYQASTEARLLPQEPTLGVLSTGTAVQSIGAFVLREWRF